MSSDCGFLKTFLFRQCCLFYLFHYPCLHQIARADQYWCKSLLLTPILRYNPPSKKLRHTCHARTIKRLRPVFDRLNLRFLLDYSLSQKFFIVLLCSFQRRERIAFLRGIKLLLLLPSARSQFVRGEFGNIIFAVEAGNVGHFYFLGALGFAGFCVGAGAKTFFVPFYCHFFYALLAFRLPLRQEGKLRYFGAYKEHG